MLGWARSRRPRPLRSALGLGWAGVEAALQESGRASQSGTSSGLKEDEFIRWQSGEEGS